MQTYVISQDPDDRDHLSYLFQRAGFTVTSHNSPERMLANWEERPGDLMVISHVHEQNLDEALVAIRGFTEAPVMILVNPASDEMVSSLLFNGADLVLFRPFGPKTLTAYAHRLLRRIGSIPSFTLPTIQLDEIQLDPSMRTVERKDRAMQRLTQLEFRLLYTLMSNRGQVIPIENLVERVWGYEGTGSRELARGLISRLRSKIEDDPRDPHFIHTVSGVGYMFHVES